MIKTIGKIVSISLIGLMTAGAVFLYGNAKSKQLIDWENVEALTLTESEVQDENCISYPGSNCYVIEVIEDKKVLLYIFDNMTLKY